MGIYAIVREETLSLLLALFIYVTCRQQFILLETGAEESLFGYDFSQGYTSLERDQPHARRRPGFVKRCCKTGGRQAPGEQETRESEERRMDELLEGPARRSAGSHGRRTALPDPRQRTLS